MPEEEKVEGHETENANANAEEEPAALVMYDVNRLHDAMVAYGSASYSEGILHGFIAGTTVGALACVLWRLWGTILVFTSLTVISDVDYNILFTE